jgi:PAS domain S-box-containing protein
VSWNSGGARLKGYGAEEIVGQPFAIFFTPEDQARELPVKALEIAERSGRFETEGWRVRKDGTRFWALVGVDPVRDHVVTRDMTERELDQLLKFG